jgi:uncharacterized protein YjbJ (UPF0337 family)
MNLLPRPLLVVAQTQENTMDKDRVSGAARQVKGAVKETVGRVIGDAKTQAEGAAEKTAGKAQNIMGGAKDAVRDTVKR